MKLNKIITAIVCLGAFSFSGFSFAEQNQSQNKDQSQELSDLLSNSNQDSGLNEVKKIINEKYPMIQKVSPNFKVSYLSIADIYELDLGEQKAYTNKAVSYLYLKGQVFVSKDGEMLNLTQNPKDFIKNEITVPVDTNKDDVKGSKSSTYQTDSMKVDADQKIHQSLNGDLYLSSLSKSNDITSLKTAAMLEYVGVDGYSPLPETSVDYVKALDLTNAVKLVYGNGKRVMILFADPDCPYCQNFEHTLTTNSNQIDVTVYVLPWALDIHKDAPEKIKFIWSQKDPSVAWKSWMTFAYFHPELIKDGTAWSKWIETTGRKMGEKSTAPTEMTNAFIEKYGLRYSPTIVFPNGEANEGDITIDKLIPYLSISEKITK